MKHEENFWAYLHGERVPQLTGLPGYKLDTYMPAYMQQPIHATHLTGTVNGLRELSFERLLSTTNKMIDQINFFHLISAPCTGTGLSPPETHLLY